MTNVEAQDLEKFLIYLRDDVLVNHEDLKAVIGAHIRAVGKDAWLEDVVKAKMERRVGEDATETGETVAKKLFGKKGK